MQSIQSRLAIGLSLSLTVLLLVQLTVVNVSIRYLTENYIVSHLQQDSEMLLASLSLTDLNKIKLDKTKIGSTYLQPFSGQYYKISIADQEFRSRSLWDTDLTHVVTNKTLTKRKIISGPQQQTLLQITNQYTKNSKSVLISVAEDLSNIHKEITIFQIIYSVITIAVIIILLFVQAVIINKNLKPLDNIRRELKSLDEGLIQQLKEDVPSEVLPLVTELNHLLKAFNQRLDRSRTATGNLAHALKTPLSLLYQLADNQWLQDKKEIRGSLLQAVKTIEENINRELKRARIAGVKSTGHTIKLEPEIQALIETLQAIYRQKNLNIHYEIPDNMMYRIDRQDLMEMLGNVLDNACQWAKNEVILIVKNNDEIQFIIEDDGPGCSEDEMTILTKRGTRLDEQVSGHGLGMSIVQDIVNDYNGKLKITRSTNLGGLCVQINLS